MEGINEAKPVKVAGWNILEIYCQASPIVSERKMIHANMTRMKFDTIWHISLTDGKR